jgi:SAM-dependent methyltransferase
MPAADERPGGLTRGDGRRLFGADAARYADGRPGYPAAVFARLVDRCGLRPGIPTLEVGAGAGQATVDLLEHGAAPLIIVEPDPGFARFLTQRFGDAVTVRDEPFEEAELADESFDLAVAATAFHWVDQRLGLEKARAALRPGGWWAPWWTIHYDPLELDDLYHALTPVLESLPTFAPEGRKSTVSNPPFGFHQAARIRDLERAGFANITAEEFRQPYCLDANKARALFATFSPILGLTEVDRARVLDEVASIIDEEFGGSVVRTAVTSLYCAQRA